MAFTPSFNGLNLLWTATFLVMAIDILDTFSVSKMRNRYVTVTSPLRPFTTQKERESPFLDPPACVLELELLIDSIDDLESRHVETLLEPECRHAWSLTVAARTHLIDDDLDLFIVSLCVTEEIHRLRSPTLSRERLCRPLDLSTEHHRC